MLGEVLELLHKNEDGGGRTREMDLQALVTQQGTMITSLTSLLQQEVLLKNALRLADDDDDMQELEDELQDANTSRKELNASKNAHVCPLSQGKFGRTLLQGFSRRVEFDGEGFYDSIADVLGNIVKR